MAEAMVSTITVDRWPLPFGPPEEGDLLQVQRTGELLEVLKVSEDGLTVTVGRHTITDATTEQES